MAKSKEKVKELGKDLDKIIDRNLKLYNLIHQSLRGKMDKKIELMEMVVVLYLHDIISGSQRDKLLEKIEKSSRGGKDENFKTKEKDSMS